MAVHYDEMLSNHRSDKIKSWTITLLPPQVQDSRLQNQVSQTVRFLGI